MTLEPIDKLSDRTGEEEDSQTLVDVWNHVAKLIDVVNKLIISSEAVTLDASLQVSALKIQVENLKANIDDLQTKVVPQVDQPDPIKHIPAPRSGVNDNGHWTVDINTGHLVEDVNGNWRIYLNSNPPPPTDEQVDRIVKEFAEYVERQPVADTTDHRCSGCPSWMIGGFMSDRCRCALITDKPPRTIREASDALCVDLKKLNDAINAMPAKQSTCEFDQADIKDGDLCKTCSYHIDKKCRWLCVRRVEMMMAERKQDEDLAEGT